MKTAVIYARYSSDNQTEQSIEGQLRVCKQYAENNDILILNTYIDRAMTGTNDNRPDFQQMIKDSSKKEFQYVLVYKLDRFSRNKYEMAKYKKILKDNGAKILSAMENIPETPEGIILESLLEGMAEYYSVELSQKVRRGLNETKLKGNFIGGTISYGYKVENHKILINEEQAENVRFIFKQYSIGTYVKDIISILNDRHIYHNGKPFEKNTIYYMLKNEKYIGIYRHEDKIYTNMYPQIVDKEVYEIVRQKVDTNKYGKRSTDTIYLLKNKLKCGYCGKPISAECGTARNGTRLHYYKCLGRKKNNGCNKSMLKKDIFESFIIDNIIQILKSPKHFDYIIDSLLKIQNQQLGTNPILDSLLKEQKQIEKSLSNIMTAIEQGIINNTTNKRMKELETQQEELNKKILIEQSKNIIKLSRGEIANHFEKALRLESKILIDYMIKEIKVFEDKIIIQFNNPLQKSPDSSQGFLLFEEYSNMPKYIQNKIKPIMIEFEIDYYI